MNSRKRLGAVLTTIPGCESGAGTGTVAGRELRFHQEHGGPLMKELHEWMETQLAEHKTEPNSGLGKAISY
jgi:hypothetical protein